MLDSYRAVDSHFAHLARASIFHDNCALLNNLLTTMNNLLTLTLLVRRFFTTLCSAFFDDADVKGIECIFCCAFGSPFSSLSPFPFDAGPLAFRAAALFAISLFFLSLFFFAFFPATDSLFFVFLPPVSPRSMSLAAAWSISVVHRGTVKEAGEKERDNLYQ